MVRYSQLSPMVIPLGPLCYIYPISILSPPEGLNTLNPLKALDRPPEVLLGELRF